MPRIPDKIGKYKVVSEVARGGMGAVYKAEHPTLDRTVIIKKLTIRGSASVRERFRREASIMMDFRNEYIVDVLDHFRDGPAYYIVQEYVDGLSLSELLYRERYLPERIALLVFRGCCRALKYAHDRSVVHRDIKPGNLLISRTGEIKLVDFGVARIEHAGDEGLTRKDTTLGTPSYMAPEQFQDTRGVDRRADIYSLGVMLYEMLTGKRPYPGSMSAETIRLIQHGRYTRPRRRNPAISRFAERTIRRAMKANRGRRYQDVGALLHRLDRRLRTATVAGERTEIASYLAGEWKPPGYNPAVRRWLPAVLLILAATLALALYYGYRTGRIYEAIFPARYGPLLVMVRVPRTSMPVGSTALGARYEPVAADPAPSGGASVTSVPAGPPGTQLPLHHVATLETNETIVLSSDRIFVPAGEYRLNIQGAAEVITRDVFVSGNESSSSGRVVVEVPGAGTRHVAFAFDVSSATSGADLSSRTAVEIKSDSSWIPFTSQVADGLVSGHHYAFRFSVGGYYPKELGVDVSTLQSRAQMDVLMMPYAGELSLASRVQNVSVTLNGSPAYDSWGPTPEQSMLPTLNAETVQLRLAPGSYDVNVRRGTSVGEYTANVKSGQRLSLVVVAGKKAGALEFENSGYASIPEQGEAIK